MNLSGRHFAVLFCLSSTIVGGCSAPPESASSSSSGLGEAASPRVDPSLSSRPLLVDATAESGLDFVHRHGARGELELLETLGAGVGLLDFDDDGDLDLYLVQGGEMPRSLDPSHRATTPGSGDRLLRNDLGASGPRFVDVTSEAGIEGDGYGMGVATGDVDGDGHVDLYVTNFGSNRLWRNRGDGTFEDWTERSRVDDERWSVGAAFFDADGDGDDDLYVGNYVDFDPARHAPCRRASSAPDYCGPLSYRPLADRLFRNRGDGTFEDVSASSGISAVAANTFGVLALDVDGDDRRDLLIASDALENHLLMQQADGRFVDEALLRGVAVNGAGEKEGSMGVDAGDADSDGDLDLFITHFDGETNTLYLADDGFYRDATQRSGLGLPSRPLTAFGTAWTDLDNDGALDLLVVNGAVRVIEEQERNGDAYPLREPNQAFRGLGDGRFEDITVATGGFGRELEVSRGLAVGDLDNDGDLDAVVSNNAGPARVYLSTLDGTRSWIGIDPRHRDGRQARALVRVQRGDGLPDLVRRAATDGSYASARDPRVLVGLGDSPPGESVDVMVTWPDGVDETFADLAIDRYHRLTRSADAGGSAP